MKDFKEIERMTLYEYELRMKAYDLSKVDREYEIHLQAWANWNVKAEKRQGKDKLVPVYRTFNQFFDYRKQIDKVLHEYGDETNKTYLKQIAIRVQEYGRRKENGDL